MFIPDVENPTLLLIESLRGAIQPLKNLLDPPQSKYLEIQNSYKLVKKISNELKSQLDTLQSNIDEPNEKEEAKITLFRSSLGTVKSALKLLENSINSQNTSKYLFFRLKLYDYKQRANIDTSLKNLLGSLNSLEHLLEDSNSQLISNFTPPVHN